MRSSAASPSTNLGGIDILRFFAAVLVMIYHYGFWLWAFPTGMAGQAASADAGALVARPDIGLLVQWGWIGVQIFFVISGFVIAFSAERATVSSFVRARVLRLVPAVWICAPVSVFAFWLATDSGGTEAVSRLLNSLAFVPFGPWVDGVYWTLGIEIAFYALILIVLATGQRERIMSAALTIGLISTVFWVAYVLSGAPAGWAESRWLSLFLVHHGCFFALGVHLLGMYRAGVTRRGLASCGVFLVGAVLQIASAAQVNATKTGLDANSAAPIVAFLLALAFMVWTLRRDFSNPFWRQLGIMTYPLYLLHSVVGAALIGGLVRGGVPYVTAIIAVSLVMIAASWLIAARVEPVIRRMTDMLLTYLGSRAGELVSRPG